MSLRRNAGCNASAILLIGSMLFAATLAIAQSDSNTNLSSAGYPQVLMSTSAGEMVIELDPGRAPVTVDNFLAYIDDGFYNETIFHRVIDGFMIQGGGFTENFKRKTTRAPVSNEAYNGLRNHRYTIAMARTNAPHSATSQFFINTANNTNLDHTDTSQRGWGYTVFGRVIQGQEVVDAISATRTSSGGPFSRDVPTNSIIIQNVTLLAPASTTEPNGIAGDDQGRATGSTNPDAEPEASAASPAKDLIQKGEATAQKTSLESSSNPLISFIQLFKPN